MSFLKSSALLGALTLVSKVSAHGFVQGIVAGGVWHSGYSPLFQYQHPTPVVAGWSIPEDINNGFVSDYTSPDIICHKGATPGGDYITVAAGDTVELQWTVWQHDHHGPVLDYLASCGDDCTTVDKTKLLFNKIDAGGLVDGSKGPGIWASDDLVTNNSSWVVTIPSSIAPGKYVLRHEIIALHVAETVGGAQNYPQCINLEITSSGTNSLNTGTLGTDLYDAHDPGILINIYQTLTSYIIPGPPLFDGSSSASQPSVLASATASATSTISAAASTSPVVSAATISPAAPFSNSTTKSHGVSITASLSKPAAAQTPASEASPQTEPTTPASTAEPTPVESPEPVETAPAIPSAPGAGEIPPTGVSPVSFSSTVTGRIGKPTRFVCYIEE